MPLNEEEVYAIDEGKNSWLTMTKEQILTAITQAVNEGTIGDIDAGFITKIQEMNAQEVVKLWLGTMAEFQALTTKDTNTLYMFTDDPTLDDIEQKFTELESRIDDIESGGSTTSAEMYLHRISMIDSSKEIRIYLTLTTPEGAPYTLETFKTLIGGTRMSATGHMNYGGSPDQTLKALIYYIQFSSNGSTMTAGIFQSNLTSITTVVQTSLSFTDNVVNLSD
nr:MAG TPA: hypothetical protein [Bacteriophage sp.]